MGIAAFALSLAGAAPASAVNRFASPDGSGSAPCTVSAPSSQVCSLTTALTASGSGDDLTLLGGMNYPSQPVLLAINANVTVHGTPGAPVTIPSTAADLALAVGPGAVLRDVRFLHTGGTGQASVAFQTGAVGERVYADAGATNEAACALANGALVRDSVCRAGGGDAIQAGAGSGQTSVVTLRNVTAIAPTESAIKAIVNNASTQLTVHATNVIAQGQDNAETDVFASTDGSSFASAIVNLRNSNYDTTAIAGAGAVTPPPDSAGPDANGNMTTSPVFANPGTGNYDQLPSSSGTIDRGTTATVNGFGIGSFDLGGGTRCAGAAPDIGADELAGAACAPPTPPGTTPAPPKKKCKKGRKLKKGKCVKKKRKKKG